MPGLIPLVAASAVGREAWGVGRGDARNLGVIEKRQNEANCSGVNYWHFGT